MAKPPSHREQIPERRCANCRHSVVEVRYRNLYCMHGENWQIIGTSGYPTAAKYIAIEGEDIAYLEGAAHAKIWARCNVDPEDICDEWEAEDGDQTV